MSSASAHEPNGPASAVTVTRLAGAEVAGLLERFDASTLVLDGKVSVISLGAISERLGRRWPARQEQVYDHVERTLGRHLGDRGIFARISDTEYLVAQPDATRFGAQASCFRYLRELLTYFLGDHRGARLQVLQVSKLSPTGIEAEPVDELEVEEGEAKERATPATTKRRFEEWSPFVASDGRLLEISCKLEPIFELKAFRRIGFRMVRSVVDQDTRMPLSESDIQRLSRSDIERTDVAAIARGIDRIQSNSDTARDPAVMVSVSYINLSNRRSRAALVSSFKEAQTLVERGLICEVTDIEGVPESAFMTALSLIKPFCLFAVGRRAPPFGAASALAGSGLHGVSLECPPDLQSEAEFVHWAREAIRVGKKVARSVMLFGAPSARHLAIAALSGASHGSLRPGDATSPARQVDQAGSYIHVY